MTSTLRTITEEVARGLGVRTFVDGTVPTLGTTSLICDPNRLEPDGEWDQIDAWIRFESGVLDGQIRRVTGFSTALVSGGLGTVQFAPAVATTVPSGTTYSIFKTYHPTDDYRVSINDALKELGMNRVTSIATTAEVSDVRRVSVPTVAGLPDAMLLLVERSVATTGSPDQYEALTEGLHYKKVQADSLMWLEITYSPATNTLLRFTYSHQATALSADTDSTSEPLIVIKALARKYLASARGDQAGADWWGREAERLRLLQVQQRPAARPYMKPWMQVGR